MISRRSWLPRATSSSRVAGFREGVATREVYRTARPTRPLLQRGGALAEHVRQDSAVHDVFDFLWRVDTRDDVELLLRARRGGVHEEALLGRDAVGDAFDRDQLVAGESVCLGVFARDELQR